MTNPKILFFDIETAPALVYTFSLFKPFIGIDQIVEDARVIAWSAKWKGKGTVKFDSEYHSDRATMLKGIRDLLDEADIVVGYNSNGFDTPWLNGEFVREGIELPSPSQYVDLYRISRRNMRLISGKLDYLARTLLGQRKVAHEGFTLWSKCIGPDGPDKDTAWRKMKKYARQDTALLEPIFDTFLPFIRNVNVALYAGDEELRCTHCGSMDVQRRGTRVTLAGRFARYQCNGCRGWSSSATREDSTPLRPI